MDPTVTILLLEDQALVRAGMRALIQICEPRATIHEASSVEEAEAALDEQAFDIAFLDIDLKGERSGLDFLRELRSREVETRAIMLSGRAGREIVMACIDAGASGYILKDMDSNGLFRKALDTVFEGGVFLPASVLGRGGFSPTPTSEPVPVTAESLGISGRTLEVLFYLCQGLPNKSIANKMGIEESTVRKDYVPKLFRLFKVVKRTELIVEVSRRGIKIPAPGPSAAPATR